MMAAEAIDLCDSDESDYYSDASVDTINYNIKVAANVNNSIDLDISGNFNVNFAEEKLTENHSSSSSSLPTNGKYFHNDTTTAVAAASASPSRSNRTCENSKDKTKSFDSILCSGYECTRRPRKMKNDSDSESISFIVVGNNNHSDVADDDSDCDSMELPTPSGFCSKLKTTKVKEHTSNQSAYAPSLSSAPFTLDSNVFDNSKLGKTAAVFEILDNSSDSDNSESFHKQLNVKTSISSLALETKTPPSQSLTCSKRSKLILGSLKKHNLNKDENEDSDDSEEFYDKLVTETTSSRQVSVPKPNKSRFKLLPGTISTNDNEKRTKYVNIGGGNTTASLSHVDLLSSDDDLDKSNGGKFSSEARELPPPQRLDRKFLTEENSAEMICSKNENDSSNNDSVQTLQGHSVLLKDSVTATNNAKKKNRNDGAKGKNKSCNLAQGAPRPKGRTGQIKNPYTKRTNANSSAAAAHLSHESDSDSDSILHSPVSFACKKHKSNSDHALDNTTKQMNTFTKQNHARIAIATAMRMSSTNNNPFNTLSLSSVHTPSTNRNKTNGSRESSSSIKYHDDFDWDNLDIITPRYLANNRKGLSPTPSRSVANPSPNQTNVVQNTPTMRMHLTKPTPSLPTITNKIGGKLYPDLRHQFIRALIHHARVTRRAIHQRGALDASLRAILIFSVYHKFPIRTAEAGARVKGIGSELLAVLKDAARVCTSGAKKTRIKPFTPEKGKFSAVAPAALVALLEYEEKMKGEMNRDENNDMAVYCCTMEELIPKINSLVHYCGKGIALKKSVDYYLDKNNLDPGWGQVRKLCGTNSKVGLEPMIKERKKKHLCPSGTAYELTERGREAAIALKLGLAQGDAPPGPLRQLASNRVDERYGDVTMSMDFREGGGGSKSLHKMCDLLDEYCVPYVVRDLKISDYVFFVGDKLAPILIERKSVDDVASSLDDGRWERQQRSMRIAQYVLGNGNERKCQICYLIEGDACRRTVHGGAVGRSSWNKSLEDVENAIKELPVLGFSVMKTKSHMGSMNILSQVARDVSWKVKNGSIHCSYTYEEFIKATKRCDKSKGDPPTERIHQYPATPVVDATAVRIEEPTHILQNPNFSGDDQNENENTSKQIDERTEKLKNLSMAELKQMCKDRDEKCSGKKIDLIARLLQKRKPEILITRSRRGQYLPKVPSCNAAILVALLLNHIPGTEGLTKEKIMMLAEETGISKDPIGGNGGWYDGWAGMKDMTKGDPALVYVHKRKYSLTTQPLGGAGVDIANAIHLVAHRENLCRCGNYVPC